MSPIWCEAAHSDVAEIQGLYGAFSFPEKLLQKIWLRRDFDCGQVRTTDGVPVTILHPGKWNRLGGPDFHLARLRFGDGREVVGDIELHLRADDWEAHAHADDEAYRGVILHVVLFCPEHGHVTRGCAGEAIPTVALLPLLHHDLEEYAADEAVEALANRPTARLTNELTAYPPEQIKDLLGRHALGRWRQKVHFAAMRVERLGWEAACHHAALEVLGFRYNRAPMLRVASRWPLVEWGAGRVSVEQALKSEARAWSVQGVRPANQPSARLTQYAHWAQSRADWPARLICVADRVPGIAADADTRVARRDRALAAWRELVSETVCGEAVAGTRFHTLLCDAFLPLIGTRSASQAAYGCWFHTLCGDMPPFVNAGLRQIGVWDGRMQPACHGQAQGLLGWLIEREVRR